MKKFSFFLLAICLMGTACNQENEPKEDDSPWTNKIIEIQDFVLSETCAWQNLKPDTVYLIHSAPELSEYLSCQEEIDFSQYSLIITWGGSPNEKYELTKQLTQTSPNEYELDLSITLEDARVASGWFVAVLVPKLDENAKVELIISNTHIANPCYCIMDTLRGEWSWTKRYGGFSGTIIDNEFSSIIKILSQNEDASINYEVIVEDTLFYKSNFQFQRFQYEYEYEKWITLEGVNIKLPHDLWRPYEIWDKLNWSIHLFEDTEKPGIDILGFDDNNGDGYIYYYERIK